MAVEATHQRPVQIQNDSEANNNNGQRLGAGFASELEAYQSKSIPNWYNFSLFILYFFFSDLNMDFESEFADFLSRDVPNPESRVRRGSNTIVSNNTSERLEYNIDGTINCSDLNYTTLVSIIPIR